MLRDERLKKVKNAGKPTYRFNPGDEVRHSGWDKCVVLADVAGDGTIYKVSDTSCRKGRIETTEHCVAWYSIRPLTAGKSNFSQNEDVCLSYSNTSIEELLAHHLNSGIDFEPVYQRGYVWTAKDRECLLDSIFMGADIGRFVLKYLEDNDDFDYEIVDGKQRLITLLDYYENRFAYRGVFFNELSTKDRRRFMEAPVAIAMIRNPNLPLKDTLRIFLLINRGGRPVTKDVLENAEQRLREIQDKGE